MSEHHQSDPLQTRVVQASLDHDLREALDASPATVVRDLAPPSRPTATMLGGSAARRQSVVARMPAAGDELFGFRLHQELGEGAFARVFLAAQTGLAYRPVVLKVSGLEGSEPQTLARVQHTNIVPILSLHEDERIGLRALCMPYFGGASLSQALTDLWTNRPAPTRGQELIDALCRVAAPDPESLYRGQQRADGARDEQTPLAVLARFDYVRAVAWIGSRLAEGLHHAHQRGVLHRDVKPSNILLSADGTPMLLDFNLAQEQDGVEVKLGGTVAYMAPEHLRAMARRSPEQTAKVDRRSDVYSLGMVLYEMLVGHRPFEGSAGYTSLPQMVESLALERSRAAPSLRAARHGAPWGLESILRRSMDPDPARRYQQADELAEDLRRFLDDRPLRFAPELSYAERMRKWARRHPRLTSSGAVSAAAVVLLVVIGLALFGARSRLASTREQLAATQAQERLREFEEGAVRAMYLVNTTTDLRDHWAEGRAVCEQTLGLYGILDRPDWQTNPDWRRLDGRLSEDARELLLLLAAVRVRLAPGDREALKGALNLVDQAEAVAGLPPCRAIGEDRASYLEALGERDAAERARLAVQSLRPTGVRDHYLLALGHARARRCDDAVRHLDEAVRLSPRHYWSWLQRGICQLERGEPALAAADFSACVGLRPDFAWGSFNRACALALCGKRAEAVADYTTALTLDPSLTIARLNRGLLRLELDQARGGLEDFDAAVSQGRDDAAVHSGRGVALERLKRFREADVAFALARERGRTLAKEARVRLEWVEAFAVSPRKPKQALSAFEAILKDDAGHKEALYGRGMVCERQGRGEEALAYYDRALESAPGFLAARRARAVALARQGEWRRAGLEINWCLDQDARGGATLYAAACVSALMARGGPRAACAQAAPFLREAFARGYGLDRVGDDRDLDGIRDEERFRAVVAEARSTASGRR